MSAAPSPSTPSLAEASTPSTGKPVKMGKAEWRKKSMAPGKAKKLRMSLQSSTKRLKALAKVDSGEMQAFMPGMMQLKAVLNEMPKAADFRAQQAAKADKKRDHLLHEVLDEILDTERNYLMDLRFIIREFAQPMKEVADAETHFNIFSNIERLEQLHTKIEADLTPARAEAKGANDTNELARLVVVALQPNIPLFMAYAVYCGKFTDAPARLAAACERSKALEAIAARAAAEFRTALAALLFRPVQRMCVYPLLLKQALKYLPEKDADMDDAFRTCFATVEKTIKKVNENVREQEAAEHMRDVLTNVVVGAEHLVSPSRKLALEMDASMRKLDAWLPLLEKKRACRLYVLTDCLLIARYRRGGSQQRLLILPLDELDVAMNAGTLEEGEDGAAPAGAAAMVPTVVDDAARSAAAAAAAANLKRNPAKRRWVRATRFVLAEERRKKMAGVSIGDGVGAGDAGGAGGDGETPAEAPEPAATNTSSATTTSTAGDDTQPPARRVSLREAMWNNLLTIAEGQLSNDPAPWAADDDIFGLRETETLTIIHHGHRSGGVYKLWAASRAECSRLVQKIEGLQEELAKASEEERQRTRVQHAGRSYARPSPQQQRRASQGAPVLMQHMQGQHDDPFEAARAALRGTAHTASGGRV